MQDISNIFHNIDFSFCFQIHIYVSSNTIIAMISFLKEATYFLVYLAIPNNIFVVIDISARDFLEWVSRIVGSVTTLWARLSVSRLVGRSVGRSVGW